MKQLALYASHYDEKNSEFHSNKLDPGGANIEKCFNFTYFDIFQWLNIHLLFDLEQT